MLASNGILIQKQCFDNFERLSQQMLLWSYPKRNQLFFNGEGSSLDVIGFVLNRKYDKKHSMLFHTFSWFYNFW